MKQATLVVFDDPNIQNGQSSLNNHIQEWLLQRNVKAKVSRLNLDNPPEVTMAIGSMVKFMAGFVTKSLDPNGNSPDEMGFKQWWKKIGAPEVGKFLKVVAYGDKRLKDMEEPEKKEAEQKHVFNRAWEGEEPGKSG